MREEFLNFLACPADKASLNLSGLEYEAGELKSGALTCTHCGGRYPVVDFIPRFLEWGMESTASGPIFPEPTADNDPQALRQILDRLYASTQPYHQLIAEAEGQGFTYDHLVEGLVADLERERGQVAVLDVASGTGHYLETAANLGALALGVDLSPHACERARQRNVGLFLAQASAEALPLRSQAFDLVLCQQLLEHTPYPERVVGEISRVLKSGGRLLLSAPNILGSNFFTRTCRALKGVFSREIKSLKPFPTDILNRWQNPDSPRDLIDLDACNKTTVFQAINLLKENGLAVVHLDTLRHPQKYRQAWKFALGRIRQQLPLLKYVGLNYKIIARKP